MKTGKIVNTSLFPVFIIKQKCSEGFSVALAKIEGGTEYGKSKE